MQLPLSYQRETKSVNAGREVDGRGLGLVAGPRATLYFTAFGFAITPVELKN
jgi:hypothetical protein